MAKDKGMKEDDMFALLKDRQKGETAYKNVSIQLIYFTFRQFLFVQFPHLDRGSEFQYVFEILSHFI